MVHGTTEKHPGTFCLLIHPGNDTYSVKRLHTDELNELSDYLFSLSPETRQRFSPHAFEQDALTALYLSDLNSGYIVREILTNKIIAYAVIRKGHFDHDLPRILSYGLTPDQATDLQFAPSVADAWQGKGTGHMLLNFIVAEQIKAGRKRIFLWGGVQKGNEQAVRFYLKNGFRTLGEFSWNGENLDMFLEL